MAIRFVCAQCFKVHRVADRCAGLPGRCGRCGYRFVAPGVPVAAPSPAFVPAAAPNLFPLAPTPPPRREAARAIGLGLALAALAAAVLFLASDRIAAAVPGLAHMLPPKAPPPPARVVAPPPPPTPGRLVFDPQAAVVVAYLIAYLVIGMALPLVAPPVLSRRGYLSVGRWLIFAGLALFLLGTLGAVYEAEVRRSFGVPSPSVWMLSGAALPLFHAIVGCAIAAAIHPKTPPPPGP